ncbi:MAG: U32 family peptidase [Ruminococcus sp.]|nr:U32 family peptidase [Ruminococcus sp.]
MAEILAPCGSPEALEAALRTGCDAVYLGGEDFSARANAANFSYEELKKAVERCHIRGVKVYQAINTVITDRELEKCAEAVRAACELGVDGLITQDLALVYIARECCPGMELHASTQMTLHTEKGVMLARELGFSRAVVSRELPAGIIRELCRLPIEIEVFVHGALCMSVSGQCFMSAVIGSRSANRGLCAQACRLPASSVRDDRDSCALSLKDMSHVGHLRELEEMGAASLKIEGRMKRPEYVAAAVDAVRRELAGEEHDMGLLRDVFSRSGFTDGYYTGKTGRDMFGYRRKEDVEASAGALSALHELYRREYKRSKVTALVKMKRGEAVSLTLTDDNGITASVSGEMPQEAVSRPADKVYLTKQIGKLGDTIYELGALDCELDDGVTLPAGALGELRRAACAELDKQRYEHFTRRPEYMKKSFEFKAPRRAEKQVIDIGINRADQLDNIDVSRVGRVYAPLKLVERLLESGFDSEKLCAVMPRFTFDEKRDTERLAGLKAKGLKDIECTNYAHIAIGRELGMKLHGGFGLNVTNTAAMKLLREMGLEDCTVSIELKASEIAALGDECGISVLAYGRIPMMLTVNCPIRGQRGCGKCTKEIYDRTGRRMPVRCEKAQGYVEILNSDTLCISDKLGDFPTAERFRVELYDESPERAEKILTAFERGEKLTGESLTKGLYYRGVK